MWYVSIMVILFYGCTLYQMFTSLPLLQLLLSLVRPCPLPITILTGSSCENANLFTTRAVDVD